MKIKEDKSKEGISLIVLVITIIVIIILATAIIVTLLSNNPMSEANKARFENDRDSMQAIFTNTVAKVMAQKQSTMEIEASALNTVTSGVSSATGDANYTLNGVVKEEEKNGRIIFDNKENTETEYYTGKQLPIYKSGETTWYVDEEGIISLKVGDNIYGDGKIVNGIKITATVVENEEFVKDKVKVRIEVAYEDELQNVIFNNETITSFERQEKLYIIEREVTKNGTYEIVANGENGATSKTSIAINEIENLNSDIQIKGTVTPSSDYVKATMGIEITLEGEVESITINGESQAVPSKNDGKYVISKELIENGEYKIEVKAKDGTTNKIVINVTGITENMEIWNRADMENFRDKVNSGKTFEGKTVTVMADIDLGGTSNNWVPIGDTNLNSDWTIKEDNVFKGTFEGNKHIISNLYINSEAYVCSGLFATSKGTIKDTILKNINITNTKEASSTSLKSTYTGGIVAVVDGNITNCGVESGVINSVGTVASYGNDYYSRYVGGCAAITYSGNSNEVLGCYNKANLTANVPMLRYNSAYVGGVVGVNQMPVKNCYNTGTLNGTGGHAIVGGVVGEASYATSTVSNIYNVGSVTGSGVSNTEQWIGGVIGKIYEISYSKWYTLDTSGYSYWYLSNGWQVSYTGIVNSSTLKSYVTNLGSAFKTDSKNINNGYPILNWQ